MEKGEEKGETAFEDLTFCKKIFSRDEIYVGEFELLIIDYLW